MKCLIWLLCIALSTLLTTLLFKASGILGLALATVPVILLVVLAWFLCKNWDDYQGAKRYYRQMAEKANATASATPPIRYPSDPVDENHWLCSCGRVHPKYVSSCVCGKGKSDALTAPSTDSEPAGESSEP